MPRTICKRDYCREPAYKANRCKKHYEEYSARRAHTATIPKCRYGNCAKQGFNMCLRCLEIRAEQDKQKRRDDFIDSLMGDEEQLT